MIVLDENIDEPQRRRLEMWRIRVRQIGVEVGRLGMKDLNEIIPLLHGLRSSTFFTWDRDFYDTSLAHTNYCLVYLDIEPTETAQFVRAFLRHQGFRRQADRLGKVCGFSKLELPIGNLEAVSQRERAGEFEQSN